MSWAGFLRRFLLVFGGALASVFALVALMNPFGNLAPRVFGAHVIMDTNDRYQYPAIVRSGAFDSAVIGTSSSRLLDPVWLEGAFGGRFANLGLNDGRAWEQYQLTLLFLRTVPRPRMLLFAIDWVWCAADADVRRITRRGFPPWIYDDNAWNDWLYVLNLGSLETAARQLANRIGVLPPRFPPNGFKVFVPPEKDYDAAKARQNIWGPGVAATAGRIVPVTPPHVPSEAERAGWRYPALAWLDELIARVPADTRIVMAFMPAHVVQQPRPGSAEAAREAECKARIAEIAGRRAAPLVDFKIASPITTDDANYWDGLHYRLPIAKRIVDGIAKVLTTRQDDPGGDWVVVTAPRRN